MGNFSKTLKSLIVHPKSSYGFTLIELIVVIAIIATLFTVISTLFNPFAQIEKSRNATRQQDTTQIRNALDTYYNDKGCYPTSITFGSMWSSGTTVYMQKIPQDPDCLGSAPYNCYDYETDGSSCPQWNILYAQMHKPIINSIATCALNTASNCLPSGGMGSYNYCAVSGKLDCNYIHQNPLPTPVVPGGGGGGNITPTPIANCNGTASTCKLGECTAVMAQGTCLGCGGTAACYGDLNCGGIKCN